MIIVVIKERQTHHKDDRGYCAEKDKWSSLAHFRTALVRQSAEKRKQKKASVNRNIKGLVVLAVLEIIGILCILGWWLQ